VEALDAGVEDADVHGSPSGLRAVSLRCPDHLHAPLLRLQRIFAFLAASAVIGNDPELASSQRLLVAGVGLPDEILPDLVHQARGA
jgi:hypothetical protein